MFGFADLAFKILVFNATRPKIPRHKVDSRIRGHALLQPFPKTTEDSRQSRLPSPESTEARAPRPQTHLRICIYLNIHININTNIKYKYKYKYMYMYMYMYLCVYIHIYIYIYIYMHAHIAFTYLFGCLFICLSIDSVGCKNACL